ncbi:GNAT family N-acetyltransferase [Jeotgalibacillus salarius]|uniref:N-acetyltransferase n=1 Tax=Jeotgalibacillus salarius TaxID=546023 RepID=A0A4Y8LCY8_9BACL|nr:GNAT family N-acetyltransferase [Jeotgalibacillus salarius]TFE00544.1 N-acetyltransferase [Jeotgalibacillus salarius]
MLTERTIIEEVNELDSEEIKALSTDPTVRKYLGGVRSEGTIPFILKEMLRSDDTSIYLTIRNRETHEFIGLVSLDPHHEGEDIEISYQLLPQWWRKGFGSEAVIEVLKYAFNELMLVKVVAETQSANHSSCRLLEKVGMTLGKKVIRFGEEQSIYFIHRH